MAKKTGLMEISLGNGIVKADAKTGMVDMKSMEKVGNMFLGLVEGDEGYRQLKHYKETKQFKELIVKLEEKLIVGKPTIENSVYFSTGRGRYAKQWANLIVAIDFAMWLNVDFKIEVIETFINKKILDFRLLGIDHFKELNQKIDTLTDRVGKDNKGCYIQISKAINIRCNGELVKGWDYAHADAEIQKLRDEILDMSKKLIDMKMIKTYSQLKEFIVNFK